MARRFLGWSEDRYSGEYPWSRVIWNCAWFPVVEILRVLFVFSILIQSGYNTARRAWKDTE